MNTMIKRTSLVFICLVGIVLFFKTNINAEDKTILYLNNPVTEFKQINPTKYRLRFHQAKEAFPFVFSESYHDEWRAYVIRYPAGNIPAKDKLVAHLSNYSIIAGNEDDQASKEAVIDYINKGWLSTLGNSNIIDFVSKNIQDTIQNDNLPNGPFYETWLPGTNKNIIQIPKIKHTKINGYANSWLIEPNDICQNNFCKKNLDGSYEIEIIIEFWRHRFFYFGGIISITAFVILAVVMIWRRILS